MFGRVTIPFAGPESYSVAQFGCPVVRGDKFSVLLCTGVTLDNPQ